MNLIKNIFFLIFFAVITIKGSIAGNSAIDYNNLIFEHITPEDGLPFPTVNDIYQDKQGYMWFATENGLCRYDAYEFKVYQHDPLDTNSLPNGNITCILEDDKQQLWIGTAFGLCVLDKRAEKFTRYFHEQNNSSSLWHNSINDIIQDQEGKIWIATSNGLNFYNESSKSVNRFNLNEALVTSNNRLKDKMENVSCKYLYNDQQNNIWIGTWKYGLLKLNRDDMSVDLINDSVTKEKKISFFLEDQKGTFYIGLNRSNTDDRHIEFKGETGEMENKFNYIIGSVRSGMIDHKDNLWVGGDKELLIYPKDESIPIRYIPDPKDKHSLSEGNINRIYQDKAGNIWISSTGKGIDVYYRYENNFNKYYHAIGNPEHRDYGKELFVDSRGYLWYGTFGDGLLLFDKSHHFVKRFYHKVSSPDRRTLAGNYIWCLVEDKHGKIWVGTDKGISVYDPNRKRFIKTIKRDNNSGNTITHNLILDILFDNDGNIWVATQEGLDVINIETDSIHHITEKDGLCHYKVIEMKKDRNGKIWLGTYNGLSCYDPVGNTFTNYLYDPQKRGYLSNQRINAIYQDSAGYIWVGTDNGLNKLNPETGEINYFFERDGLINNQVNNIFADKKGNLWINTPVGISKINIERGKIINYGRDNGLKINHTGMCLHDDILYLAGENTGYYKFSIHKIKSNPLIPPVYITEIKVNGTIYNKGKQKQETLRFTHNQSSFEFKFTALNFLSSSKNQFKYKLEGFDERWFECSAQKRYAVYNNLLPGEYIFHVKGSNNNALWNEEEASFHFTILPPWWKIWWAYLLYFIIFISLVYLFVYLRKNSMQLKIQKEKSRIQHEMDEMKLNFFTDISHELRTPLSLIKGVVDRFFSTDIKSITKDNIQKYSGFLKRNTERLLLLIEQIMDIRKLDQGTVSLRVQKIELVQFIKYIAVDFQEYSKAQGIDFTFDTIFSTLEGWIDKEKLEKILFNLLSNALKYTDSFGNINLKIKTPDFPLYEGNDTSEYISICIFNSGEPIPENELSRIFERFHRVSTDGYTKQQGTGVGLSLVKKLTELHKGKVVVKSTPGEGNTFEVILPVSKHFYNEDEIRQGHGKSYVSDNEMSFKSLDNRSKETQTRVIHEDEGEDVSLPELLIVEDNQDVRDFIKMLFSDTFNVIEASNGKEGVYIACDIIPDIIIADIVMPEMDGIELSRILKEDINTSHVPIILLTARTHTESHIKGIRSGADAYITKPFDEQILQNRVYQLLESRKKLREKYGKGFAVLPRQTKKKPESADDTFLEQVIINIDQNISNAQLSPDFLVENSGMCKTNFYKKFKSLTDYPVNKFIMIYRLKKAAQLLQESNLTISEISYSVGFTYISHFTRNFKDHFGKSPSEFRNELNGMN